MDKINIIAPGDSGPVGGGKINDNFIELVQVLFGQTIWNGNVSESVSAKLSQLTTSNKTSILGALNELFARTGVIDDAQTNSVFKTWSTAKLVAYFAKLAGDQNQQFYVADATENKHAVNKLQLDTAISDLLNSAPGTLDTLNELAIALGNDPNFATTTAAALANRLRVDIATQNLTETQKINALNNAGIEEIVDGKDPNQEFLNGLN